MEEEERKEWREGLKDQGLDQGRELYIYILSS